MGSDSIAHDAEGRMDYWLRGNEGERNNCCENPKSWSKISRQNNFSKQNAIQPQLFWFSKRALFAVLVSYNIEPSSSSTNQNVALIIDH